MLSIWLVVYLCRWINIAESNNRDVGVAGLSHGLVVSSGVRNNQQTGLTESSLKSYKILRFFLFQVVNDIGKCCLNWTFEISQFSEKYFIKNFLCSHVFILLIYFYYYFIQRCIYLLLYFKIELKPCQKITPLHWAFSKSYLEVQINSK